MRWLSGMGARFTKILAVSACGAIALFILLHIAGNIGVNYIVEDTDFQANRNEARLESFQEYVTENDIAAHDSNSIIKWYENQPLVLMEITRDGKLLFNSSYLNEEGLYDRDIDANLYDWYSYYPITFSDGIAQTLILGDDSYQLRMWSMVAEIIASILLFLAIFLHRVRKIASYIDELSEEVLLLEGGELDHPISVRGSDELAQLASGLDSMRLAFKDQRESEALSLEANQALITGMSHDLRTPLTKIKLYTEILRKGRFQDSRQAEEYLELIDRNAEQIRSLSDNIFQYSISASETEISLEKIDASAAFQEALVEFTEFLQRKNMQIEGQMLWPNGKVLVCAPFVKRLIDNVSSNIEKYADRAQPVEIRIVVEHGRLGLSFRNAVAEDAKKGSNVGLANIRYMMSRMNGSAYVENNGEWFCITLWFQYTVS